MKYLLTLLLLFLAPDESALAPVLSTIEGTDNSIECSDAYYWAPDHTYYTWESCLFDYSGTIDDEPRLSREDHQALYEQVWSDYMGDRDPPRLRRGQAALTEVCADENGEVPEWVEGCFNSSYEPCGPWLMCLVPETIAVKHNGERMLLHEVAHAIHDISRWNPFWGLSYEGVGLGTDGHGPTFRCLLLEIYNTYTDDVATDAYEMLHHVCTASGWTYYSP